jgi:hypothetical protein
MPAWRVRTYVGEDIWRSYFKFSFERNPWDRQVSWYHYKTKSLPEASKPTFTEFNADRRRAYVENWDLYTIDGAIVLDYIGRYESLAEDFGTVLARIGLSGKVELPRTNVSRSRDSNYRDYFDERSKALVEDWYASEIRHFGYTF